MRLRPAPQPARQGSPRRVAWRAALAAATAFTLIEALTPPRDHPLQLVAWEKGDHIIAFAVLAAAATLAFPGASMAAIGGALVGLGAGIEVLQALPGVGRDPALADVGWDTLAVFVTLSVIALLRRIARRRTAFPNI